MGEGLLSMGEGLRPSPPAFGQRPRRSKDRVLT